MSRVIALIPAAGRGLRMQSNIEKPYLTIGGRPLLAHTLDAFDRCPAIDGCLLVVDAQRRADCRTQIVETFGYARVCGIVAGGETRQESVYLGLRALDGKADIVVVHDAARPCIDPALIAASVEYCRRHGATLTAVPVKDTVKVAHEGVVTGTLDRSMLWLAQTPQTFPYGLLRAAHERAREEGYDRATDDAELVERAGHPVTILPGDYNNIKVTTPEDLERAAQILGRRSGILRK